MSASSSSDPTTASNTVTTSASKTGARPVVVAAANTTAVVAAAAANAAAATPPPVPQPEAPAAIPMGGIVKAAQGIAPAATHPSPGQPALTFPQPQPQPPVAPMKRSARQYARQFLAKATQRDGLNTQRAYISSTANVPTKLWCLEISSPTGEAFQSASAVLVSLFNNKKKKFVGITYTVPLTGPLPTVLSFHSAASFGDASVTMEVVSIVDDQQKSQGWGYLPLSPASPFSLDIRSGTSQLLTLNPNKWSNSLKSKGSIRVELSHVDTTPAVARHVPQDTLYDASHPPPGVENPTYALALENLAIQLPPDAATKVLGFPQQEAKWHAACFVHNTYGPLSQPVEREMTLAASGNTLQVPDNAALPLRMTGVPLHKDAALVIVLLCTRAEMKKRPIGVVVVPINQEPASVADADVVFNALPLMRGPLCMTEYILLPTHAAVPTNVTLGVTVRFEGTPRPAKRVEKTTPGKTITTRQKRGTGSPPKALPAARQFFTDDGAVPAADDKKKEIPADKGIADDGTVPRADAEKYGGKGRVQFEPSEASSTGETGTSSRHYEGGGRVRTDIFQVQRMLTELTDEVRTLGGRLASHEQPSVVPGAAYGYGGTQVPTPDEPGQHVPTEIDTEGVEILELRPRRIRVPYHLRAKLVTGACALPQPDARPMARGGLAQQLPDSKLSIRFEGLTSQQTLPVRVKLEMAFLNYPVQHVGPFELSPLETNKDSNTTTYRCLRSANPQPGILWQEPSSKDYEDLLQTDAQKHSFFATMRGHKMHSTVYVNVLDADTHFYLCTCAIPLSKFARPPHVPAVSSTQDFDLYVDDAATGNPLAVGASFMPPTMNNVGSLHVSVCSIGYRALSDDPKPLATRRSNTVVVERLPLDFGDAKPKPPPVDSKQHADTATKDGTVAYMGMERKQLHAMRVEYLQTVMRSRTPNAPIIPNEDDVEYKLRFAEKRRDEIKSQRISQCLRERLTVTHTLYAPLGCPESVATLFTNPYNRTMTFHIDNHSPDMLSLSRATTGMAEFSKASSSVFVLNSRESVTLPFVFACTRAPEGEATVVAHCAIQNERKEVIKIVEVKATVGPRVCHRRYMACGPPNSTYEAALFVRTLPAGVVPMGQTSSAHVQDKLRQLLFYPRCADPAVELETRLNVDPIMASKVNGWEVLHIRTPIGSTPRTDTVYIFEDEGCERLWECWEIVVEPCQEFDTPQLTVGEANAVTLPFGGARVFVDAAGCSAAVESPNECTLHIHPREPGARRLMLHAVDATGKLAHRLFCRSLAVMPTPSQVLEIRTFAEADKGISAPQHRKFTFTNQSSRTEFFTAHHNYLHLTALEPREPFELAPQQSQSIMLRVRPLHVGRYGLTFWVNNSQDKTVECIFLDVHVADGTNSIAY